MDIALYHRADSLYRFPFVSSFFLSFTEYDLMSPPVFNGIENYRYMLTEDSLFWKSMGVTFAYVFLTIP
jgi:oligogalacturonide transport system permease protein